MKKLIFILGILASAWSHAGAADGQAVAQQLVERHFAIWNDPEPDHWTARFPQVYARDVFVGDYGGTARGYAGVAQLIRRVQGTHPGFRFTAERVSWNHGVGRVTWHFGPAEDPEQVRGEDVFTVRNGKLASLRVFIDNRRPALASGVRSPGIDHVGVNVPDLKQAREFFASTFGCEAVTQIGPFDMAPRADSVTLAMLRCGSGANIELFEYRNSNGSSVMPKIEDIGASHIAFYTDDVQAGVAYLKSQGITIIGEPMTMTSGDTAGETWVHFLSPWGSELELVGYPKGKAYEKTAARKLWHPKHPAD